MNLKNPSNAYFIYIDTETTGLPDYKQKIYPGIIEIGALDSQSDKQFQAMVNPGDIKISQSAKQVHGYSDQQVSNCDKLPIVWEKFKSWITDVCGDSMAVLVSYNGKKFDFEILRADLYRYNIKLECNWLFADLYLHANHIFAPYVYQKEVLKLDFLVQRISQQDFKKKHNAVDDCKKLRILHYDIQQRYGMKTIQNELYFNIKLFNNIEIFQYNQKLLLNQQNKKQIRLVLKGLQVNKNEYQVLQNLNLRIIDIYEEDYDFDYLIYDLKDISNDLIIAINQGKQIINKQWIDYIIEIKKMANHNNFLFKGINIFNQYGIDIQDQIKKAQQNKGFLKDRKFSLHSESLNDLIVVIQSAIGQIIQQENLNSSNNCFVVFENNIEESEMLKYTNKGYQTLFRKQIYQFCLNQEFKL